MGLSFLRDPVWDFLGLVSLELLYLKMPPKKTIFPDLFLSLGMRKDGLPDRYLKKRKAVAGFAGRVAGLVGRGWHAEMAHKG